MVGLKYRYPAGIRINTEFYYCSDIMIKRNNEKRPQFYFIRSVYISPDIVLVGETTVVSWGWAKA